MFLLYLNYVTAGARCYGTITISEGVPLLVVRFLFFCKQRRFTHTYDSGGDSCRHPPSPTPNKDLPNHLQKVQPIMRGTKEDLYSTYHHGERQEPHEIPVVVLAHAVGHKRAVVIEAQDALVTRVAMLRSRNLDDRSRAKMAVEVAVDGTLSSWRTSVKDSRQGQPSKVTVKVIRQVSMSTTSAKYRSPAQPSRKVVKEIRQGRPSRKHLTKTGIPGIEYNEALTGQH